MEDLYQILNIPQTATSQQIKEAYYSLAKKFHPDRNKGNRFFNEEKFKKITKAYSILSNIDQKKKYDQKRQDQVNFQQYQNSPPPPSPSPSAQPPSSLNAHIILNISLEESHTGCIKNIQFKKKINMTEKVVKLSVDIPKGIQNGQKFLLKGQSHQFNSQKGDLVVKINIKKHPLFQRRDHDLYMKLPLSITDALFGKKMTIPNLTGQALILIKPHAYSGQLLKLKGQGFYFKDGITRGDLILEIKIDIPKQITEEDKRWFQNFKKRENSSVAVTEFNLKAQKLLLQRAS